VVTLKDYNRYCYYVAGLVGVGLSRLFAAGGAWPSPAAGCVARPLMARARAARPGSGRVCAGR
jgi:phytoene/squalene synthetase